MLSAVPLVGTPSFRPGCIALAAPTFTVVLEDERLKSYIITQIMAPKWPLITALKPLSAVLPWLF